MSVRARIGLIVPSVNRVIEDDLRRFCPTDVGWHVSRVRLNASSEEALQRAVEAIPEAADALHDCAPDAVALACTGAAMTAGADPVWRARIAGPRAVPMTTTVEALSDALAALGSRRVALFSPFEEWFNLKEAAMLEGMGVAVTGTHGLAFANPRDCAILSPDEIVAGGLAADTPEADAIFLSCANIRGMEAIEALEMEAGKPVLTSNQVVFWRLLQAIGIPTNAMPGALGRIPFNEVTDD